MRRHARFLKDHHLPLVLVDAPHSEHFTVMQSDNVITDPALAYLRLHGRNERGYLTGKSAAEQFDYDYSPADINEIAERIQGLASKAQKVHVAFDNNRAHYAPKAAVALKEALEAKELREQRVSSTARRDFTNWSCRETHGTRWRNRS